MDVQHHCVIYPCLLHGITIWLDLKKETDLSLATLITRDVSILLDKLLE